MPDGPTEQPVPIANQSAPPSVPLPQPSAPLPPPPANPSIETITANDGALPINKPTAPDSASNQSEPTPATIPPADSLPRPGGISLPSVVVSEADIEATKDESEHLSEQIEVLTGEIQALESKIEHLTGSPATDSKIAPMAEPELMAPPVHQAPAPEHSQTNPPAPSPATSPETNSHSVATPVPITNNRPVTDIYAKVAEKEKEAQIKEEKAHDGSEHTSGIGTIGEVLAVFGIIFFVILLASPLLKGILSTDLVNTVKQIGWPTATVCLLLGFLFSLALKGKGLLKIVSFLFFLISAVMTLAAMGQTNLLGPLANIFQPLFDFYK